MAGQGQYSQELNQEGHVKAFPKRRSQPVNFGSRAPNGDSYSSRYGKQRSSQQSRGGGQHAWVPQGHSAKGGRATSGFHDKRSFAKNHYLGTVNANPRAGSAPATLYVPRTRTRTLHHTHTHVRAYVYRWPPRTCILVRAPLHAGCCCKCCLPTSYGGLVHPAHYPARCMPIEATRRARLHAPRCKCGHPDTHTHTHTHTLSHLRLACVFLSHTRATILAHTNTFLLPVCSYLNSHTPCAARSPHHHGC